MTTTIQKWGNSQGIRLPKIILDDLKISEGEEVEIFAEDDAIIIRAVAKKRKSIQKLFEDYKGDYEPELIDWGTPVGKELW